MGIFQIYSFFFLLLSRSLIRISVEIEKKKKNKHEESVQNTVGIYVYMCERAHSRNYSQHMISFRPSERERDYKRGNCEREKEREFSFQH